jgi:ParB-like chromosome segregation protein Spo0J
MLTTGTLLHLGGDAYAHPDLEPLLTPISDVVPHPDNPRNGDTEAIIESIRRHGLYAGVAAQRGTRRIIVGNHRYAALMELGAERLPVTWADVDDDLALRILLGDNKIGDLARNDEAQLLDLLRRLDDYNGTGFTPRDLERLISRVEAPMDLLAGLGDGDRLIDDEDALARATAESADLFHLPYGLNAEQRTLVLEAVKVCRQLNPTAGGPDALAIIAAHYLRTERPEA